MPNTSRMAVVTKASRKLSHRGNQSIMGERIFGFEAGCGEFWKEPGSSRFAEAKTAKDILCGAGIAETGEYFCSGIALRVGEQNETLQQGLMRGSRDDPKSAARPVHRR